MRKGLLLSVLALITACSPQDDERPLTPEVQRLPQPVAVPESPEYASHLSTLVFQSLTTALESAQALNTSIRILVEAPDEDRLNLAREQWRTSYSAYLTSQAAGSIPVREPAEWYSARLTRGDLSLQMNSWPIEPGYIDYVDGYAFSGIVNDTALELTTDSLLNQHRFSDATYVSIGYPALEFMLWGEDGQRSASDFDALAGKPDENTPSPV
ncbi:MAG: imelysin family protein, partial [Thalassolituus sp.]